MATATSCPIAVTRRVRVPPMLPAPMIPIRSLGWASVDEASPSTMVCRRDGEAEMVVQWMQWKRSHSSLVRKPKDVGGHGPRASVVMGDRLPQPLRLFAIVEPFHRKERRRCRYSLCDHARLEKLPLPLLPDPLGAVVGRGRGEVDYPPHDGRKVGQICASDQLPTVEWPFSSCPHRA